MKQITGYLVDVWNGTAGPVTIDKSLESYYKILGCDCIDIVSRVIGRDRREFDIICDDEALCKEEVKISAIDCKGEAMLCSNLFVVKFDGVDDVTDLTEDDIKYIAKHIDRFATILYPEPYPMLTFVEYP